MKKSRFFAKKQEFNFIFFLLILLIALIFFLHFPFWFLKIVVLALSRFSQRLCVIYFSINSVLDCWKWPLRPLRTIAPSIEKPPSLFWLPVIFFCNQQGQFLPHEQRCGTSVSPSAKRAVQNLIFWKYGVSFSKINVNFSTKTAANDCQAALESPLARERADRLAIARVQAVPPLAPRWSGRRPFSRFAAVG